MQSALIARRGNHGDTQNQERTHADSRYSAAQDSERRFFAATRQGKKPVTVFLDADAHLRLKRLAVDTGDTMQDLMAEALADLFTSGEGKGMTLIRPKLK